MTSLGPFQSQYREIATELEAAERRVKDVEREAAAARDDAIFQKNTLRTYEKRYLNPKR
jgi:hypothetical protein